MKTMIKLLLCAGLLYACASSAAPSSDDQANKQMLPNPFPVYTDGKIILNHPSPGLKQTLLPTINDDRSIPGCYIACYSHESKGAVYSVGNNIFVHGQVRVPGKYINRICVPTGYDGKEISGADVFKKLCNAKIPTCKDCWAGGDTGGWF